MTREQTIEAIRIMQEFVDGKEVECWLHGHQGWHTTNNPSWNWVDCIFRIKPTTVLRPWTADEVPLGGQMRTGTNGEYRWLIDTSGHNLTRREWFESCEHSTDGGKNWLPCGVVEESK